MVAENSIYAAEAWSQGWYCAALFGLTFGLGVFPALAEPATSGERFVKYVGMTALLPVGFGVPLIVLALNGSGSMDTALAFTAGLAAWNFVEYYLFPGAIMALILGFPRLIWAAATVVGGIRSLAR